MAVSARHSAPCLRPTITISPSAHNGVSFDCPVRVSTFRTAAAQEPALTVPAHFFSHGSVTEASLDCSVPRFVPELPSARDARSCTSFRACTGVYLEYFSHSASTEVFLECPSSRVGSRADDRQFYFIRASTTGSALAASACDARSIASLAQYLHRGRSWLPRPATRPTCLDPILLFLP